MKILAIGGLIFITLYGIGILFYSMMIQAERVREYEKERER
jgi:hypothetical protein